MNTSRVKGLTIQVVFSRKFAFVTAILTCLFFDAALPKLSNASPVPQAARQQTLISGSWQFTPSDTDAGIELPGYVDSLWQRVTIPHTWYTKAQPVTEKNAWYRTHFQIPPSDADRELYLSFDGVATIADVYLNGVKLGEHEGAYTRFIFDATSVARIGSDNLLAVKVDNDNLDTADSLPSGNHLQLYRVYGGIYRKVWLLDTAKVHIDPTDDAASGVFVTPTVTNSAAVVKVQTLVRNDSAQAVNALVKTVCYDAANTPVARSQEEVLLPTASSGQATVNFTVNHPKLWGIGSPNLYHVTSFVFLNERLQDSVTETTGFRYFKWSSSGLILNGVLIPLRGVAKHQETETEFSAVTDEDLKADWDDMESLGVNFVRLPHYPHAKLEYDIADQKGIVVWAENGHSNTGPTTTLGEQLTREMIRQNYNHPSIIIWSVGNEAIAHNDASAVADYANVARSEDSTRLIAYASNSGPNIDAPLDLVARNIYLGWYGDAKVTDFASCASASEAISENGAGGVITCHTADNPTFVVDHYEPEEFQNNFAAYHYQVVFATPAYHVPLYTWWVFREFNDPKYKGVNSKGLETIGGYKKDIYYLLQSYLKPSVPIVHLNSKAWFIRQNGTLGGIPTIEAFSNAKTLRLTLNRVAIGTANNGDYVLPWGGNAHNVFSWSSVLKPGRNDVTVDDEHGTSDSGVIYYQSGGSGIVQGLRSSNTNSAAYFIDIPVQAQFPVFDDFDGTADNTFDKIPAILEGARQIVTGRLSKPTNLINLSFTVRSKTGQADVFIVVSSATPVDPALIAGFTDTGVSGVWRDNSQRRVPFEIYSKVVANGSTVTVTGTTADYVVMAKEQIKIM